MKSSKIGTAKVGGWMVLSPKESLTYLNCEELEAMFNECTNQHKTKIILDCKAVSYLDSEALELLLRMHEGLKEQGGVLKIFVKDGVCSDILIATRLINVFYIYQDINEAMRSGL